MKWALLRTAGAAATSQTASVRSTDEPIFPTKALAKFLGSLAAREAPVLLDLGQVVGANVSFFGERLGCKILVEDIFGDLDRFVRASKLGEFPAFLEGRFAHAEASVDGILCWDLIDYLDRPAASALATQLTRILRPGGTLLGMFGTVDAPTDRYTKFVVVDETHLQYRSYPSAPVQHRVWLNRDIIKLFEGLLVSESFLLKSNTREILFRRPAYVGATPTPN